MRPMLADARVLLLLRHCCDVGLRFSNDVSSDGMIASPEVSNGGTAEMLDE